MKLEKKKEGTLANDVFLNIHEVCIDKVVKKIKLAVSLDVQIASD